ncbi:MED7 protein-domain-containing protein [Bombardia bombarda]|uniref:Mediator of RNA polymerase II transcription subunit 7 n=1 Tax=Bombardia bombarda TaxID=252184 RepID=A0AA40C986_9PEZI|nr:MED7 protein-domain-containing protein [Bombardia bombarda]
MANLEDGEGKTNAAMMPDPPPFWKSFTPDNLARFDTLKQEFADQHGADIDTIVRIPDISEDLVYLQPPAEPIDSKYRLFDEPQTLAEELQTLEAGGIDRLGPLEETDKDGKHIDRAFELKRLAKSMLLNFLELMGIMSNDPAQGQEKVADLKTLLLNFHHVLNEYRPHQAREQLIQLMQDQLDAKRAETAAIRGVVDKAKRALEGLGSMEAPAPPAPSSGISRYGGSNSADRNSETWPGAKGLVAPPGMVNGTLDARHEGSYWGRENISWACVDGDFA